MWEAVPGLWLGKDMVGPYLLIAAFPTELPATPSAATRAIAAAVASTAAVAVATVRRVGGGRFPLTTFHAEPAHALLACAAVAKVREGRVVGAVVADGTAAGCRSGMCGCG